MMAGRIYQDAGNVMDEGMNMKLSAM
jgi:hypothetical protein